MIDAQEIARQLGATPADIPGLWNFPGYPELTTGQLLQIWDNGFRSTLPVTEASGSVIVGRQVALGVDTAVNVVRIGGDDARA